MNNGNNAQNAQNAAGAAAQNGPPPPQPPVPVGLPVGAAGIANRDPHSTCVDPKNNPFCKDPLLNHVNKVFIANGVPHTH